MVGNNISGNKSKLISIVVLLYLYIRYTYRENDHRFIFVKRYEQDNDFGLPQNKETKIIICPNCLINHKIEYKVNIYDDYCICSKCKEEYSKGKQNLSELWSVLSPR